MLCATVPLLQLAVEPAAASTPETETETETEEETFSPDSGGWAWRQAVGRESCMGQLVSVRLGSQKCNAILSRFAAPHKCHAHPSTDVVLSPHALPRSRSAASQPAEEDAAAGAMFAADDLPAARTASTMLRDVRGIRTAQQAQQAGAKEPSAAGESAGREVSEELPVSVSPPDAEAITVAAPAAAAPTPPAGTAEEPAATPAYRSAALHRLAQIFGGLRGGPSEGGAGQGGGLTAAATEVAAAEEEGDEEVGLLPQEAALPLSPVQKYISYRRAFAGLLVLRETQLPYA